MDPTVHPPRRRPMRVRGYDYSQPGMYFVTIPAARKRRLFGTIERGRARLNEAGEIVRHAWQSLPRRFPRVRLDAFVVMPDHMHGIVLFQPAATKAGGASPAPTAAGESLGAVIAAFKSQSAIEVNRLLKRSGPSWQRSYYEHIVRGGEDLDEIRRYILENPLRWSGKREGCRQPVRLCSGSRARVEGECLRHWAPR